jgi:hypothetical protein
MTETTPPQARRLADLYHERKLIEGRMEALRVAMLEVEMEI